MQQDEILTEIQAVIADLKEHGASEADIRAQFENAIRAEFLSQTQIAMTWIKLQPWIPGKPHQEDTWPEEGIEVLVSDGEHYDVAWYLYSQSYMWMKTSVKNDQCVEFVDFIPTHWAAIREVKPIC